MSSTPRLVCPACRLELTALPSGSSRCQACRRTYPEVAGIPDLRLASDRYLPLAEDRAKAERLAGMDHLSFEDLVDAYWRMTPEVPADLAARYARTAAEGVHRAEVWLEGLGPPGPADAVLDVGCGTGSLAVAAAGRGASVTGVDLALRWLVVARRLCEEHGADVRLVAADGAVLPFRGGSFDRTVSIQVVEHAADQRGLVQSCIRSVRPGGEVQLVAANRFSLAPDPAVGLFGVGYLPRAIAVPYVERRRKTRYEFLRPVSVSELRAFVGLRRDVSVKPAPLPAPPSSASSLRRRGQAAYERLRSAPATHIPLVWLGPFLEVSGRLLTPEPGSEDDPGNDASEPQAGCRPGAAGPGA